MKYIYSLILCWYSTPATMSVAITIIATLDGSLTIFIWKLCFHNDWNSWFRHVLISWKPPVVKFFFCWITVFESGYRLCYVIAKQHYQNHKYQFISRSEDFSLHKENSKIPLLAWGLINMYEFFHQMENMAPFWMI